MQSWNANDEKSLLINRKNIASNESHHCEFNILQIAIKLDIVKIQPSAMDTSLKVSHSDLHRSKIWKVTLLHIKSICPANSRSLSSFLSSLTRINLSMGKFCMLSVIVMSRRTKGYLPPLALPWLPVPPVLLLPESLVCPPLAPAS